MSGGTLYTTGTDQRLSAWIKIQEHQKCELPPGLNITISREYGCEGHALAESLAEILNRKTKRKWAIFDKALLEKLSDETEISELFLRHLGDDTKILDYLSGFMIQHTTHSEAYQLIVKRILKIAKKGDAIIVGQGGAIITQELTNCLHFRLKATEAFRIKLIQKELNLSEEAAEKNVKDNQRWREQFINEMLCKNIDDSSYYNAVFNNEKNSIKEIAEAIFTICIPKLSENALLQL